MIEALALQGVTYAEVTLGAGVVLWRGFDFRYRVAGDPRGAAGSVRQSGRSRCGGISTRSGSSVRTTSMEVAELAAKYVGEWRDFVRDRRAMRCAVRPRSFARLTSYAKDAGLRLTAHAGETAGPESIRAALEIGAERIGHGIRAVEDPGFDAASARGADSAGGLHYEQCEDRGGELAARRIRCGGCSMPACRSR